MAPPIPLYRASSTWNCHGKGLKNCAKRNTPSTSMSTNSSAVSSHADSAHMSLIEQWCFLCTLWYRCLSTCIHQWIAMAHSRLMILFSTADASSIENAVQFLHACWCTKMGDHTVES